MSDQERCKDHCRRESRRLRKASRRLGIVSEGSKMISVELNNWSGWRHRVCEANQNGIRISFTEMCKTIL